MEVRGASNSYSTLENTQNKQVEAELRNKERQIRGHNSLEEKDSSILELAG